MIPASKSTGGTFLARRAARRWTLVLFWGIFLPFSTFAIGRGLIRHPNDPAWVYYTLFAINVSFATVMRSLVKPFYGLPPAPNPATLTSLYGPARAGQMLASLRVDEREAHQRDHIHFIAYRFLHWFAQGWLALLVVAALIWPGSMRWLAPLFLFLLVAVIGSLPQTLILWTEPDIEVRPS